MKLKNNQIRLTGKEGDITLKRNVHGIPEISANCPEDLGYGLGWAHACDRQLQVLLTRILLQGRASELLAADPALLEIDRYMRRMNFLPDPVTQADALEPQAREQLQSYADGFNQYIREEGTVFELKLLGCTPEPWTIRDTLLIGKIFGFIGLADAQGTMERLIVQMIQKGLAERKLKELFPYITETIDYDLIKKVKLSPPLVPEAVRWLQKIPRFTASNNWAVAGRHTRSGKPIYCSDPHLEINRLPSVWYEMVLRLPDNTIIGGSIPGTPGVAIGRNNRLAWGATYSFMDMIDFRIEHCREGTYRRGGKWLPFSTRREIIRVKKGESVVETVYENENGVIEGEPLSEGYYLAMNWSAARNCGAGEFNGLLGLLTARTVKEGMSLVRKLDAASFNFVFADTEGNIGYQMSGRTFRRPRGTSGLIPLPAWEKKYSYTGFADKALLPSLYNPPEGIIVTANQDLNHFGGVKAINLPMASYRAERIHQVLKRKKKLDVGDMKKAHFDLYSLQAERLMRMIRPLLPQDENGFTLKGWEMTYTADSPGASLFESVYQSALEVVFGDHGMGRDVVRHLMKETNLFNDYYGNFDAILMKSGSAWFEGKKREDLLRQAVLEGLSVKPEPWGRTRRVMLSHLLFGGKLPRFLGFDRGPVALPGCRATIPQGQIFRSAGRVTTYSPSFRLIADMSTAEAHTTLAGGVSDRRFSRWYVNDLDNWIKGVYKVLS